MYLHKMVWSKVKKKWTWSSVENTVDFFSWAQLYNLVFKLENHKSLAPIGRETYFSFHILVCVLGLSWMTCQMGSPWGNPKLLVWFLNFWSNRTPLLPRKTCPCIFSWLWNLIEILSQPTFINCFAWDVEDEKKEKIAIGFRKDTIVVLY